jgi:hypothetical protein
MFIILAEQIEIDQVLKTLNEPITLKAPTIFLGAV